MRAGLIVLMAATLSGCAAHSFPLSNKFVYPVEPACSGTEPCIGKDAAQVFADTNGTLYPSGWQSFLRPKMSKKRPGEGKWLAGSLLASSTLNPKFRRLIERDETRQYGELKAFGQRHQRVFILVHGYNASVEETNIPFSAVESQLDLKSGDGVVRFYWDGLIGKGVGVVKTWLRASSASQTVGSRAFRGVLNQFEGRDVFIIAHSRGASVVMSALGNPIYKPKFMSNTAGNAKLWGKSYRTLLTPKPLADHANHLNILLLAPAIDRIDFCDASEQSKVNKDFVCTKFRPLGGQVKTLAYTVNADDPVLGKFFLSSRALTPTGFGYAPEVGRELKAETYTLLQEYLMEKPASFHAFKDYAAHPVFQRMLRDAGVARYPAP